MPKQTWYKVETRQPIYRTYLVQADSSALAEQRLENDLANNRRDYDSVDEWLLAWEKITPEDTEEIDDEEEVNATTIRWRSLHVQEERA